ncbi:MAG: carboxypeptidase-like regulatory domain-containing protein [Thermoanaerobaculia bacterium]|nr:carboxypeptidase-like regulatory domain-containing protein [Thermoanaerobaculia bacterium]
MPRIHIPVALVLLAALCAVGAAVAEPEPDALEVPLPDALVGEVRSATTPLAQAWVYAYEIAHFSLRKVATSEEGVFRFSDLPAGLYKVIAFKSGFAPAIVMLSRATGDATQRLELELTPDESRERSEGGFWELRERIPSDVLRDIQVQGLADARSGALELPDARLKAEMQAMTGVSDGLEYGAASVSGGRLDIDGRIRDLEVELAGHYSELEAQRPAGGHDAVGESRWFTLAVDNRDRSRIGFASFNNRLLTSHGGGSAPVDFESHSVSWSQRYGEASRSDFSAQYVSESNFHRQAAIDPAEIPAASRALRFEGSYTTPLSERATLEAGFRYQERENEYLGGPGTLDLASQESVELFGRGGIRVKPTVVVEYGLYSKLRDGTVSLAPQGGVVVQLSRTWRASTLASHRLEEQRDPAALRIPEFHPVFHEEAGACGPGDKHCYQLLLSRSWNDEQELSVAAVHRQIGDTLRLYFDRDFFSRLESLTMVRGDQLPELKLGLTRRLSPTVLTRLESNLAAGGGGIVQTAEHAGYENRLRYLVTSLDTRFEQSDTGVFLAFHRLRQELDPIGGAAASMTETEVDLERLQLSLTQDLGILRSLAADWAVHLNMELSRGSTPETAARREEELRKRLTGGIAVSF